MGTSVNDVGDMTLEVKIYKPAGVRWWSCSATIKNFFTENEKAQDFDLVFGTPVIEGVTTEEREKDALNQVETGVAMGVVRCKELAEKNPKLEGFFNACTDFLVKLINKEEEIKTVIIHEN